MTPRRIVIFERSGPGRIALGSLARSAGYEALFADSLAEILHAIHMPGVCALFMAANENIGDSRLTEELRKQAQAGNLRVVGLSYGFRGCSDPTLFHGIIETPVTREALLQQLGEKEDDSDFSTTIREYFGGSRELFLQTITSFLGERANLCATLREVANAGDWSALQKTAHRMTGSVSLFGVKAKPVTQRLRDLESMAAQRISKAEADARSREIVQLLVELSNELENWRDATGSKAA